MFSISLIHIFYSREMCSSFAQFMHSVQYLYIMTWSFLDAKLLFFLNLLLLFWFISWGCRIWILSLNVWGNCSGTFTKTTDVCCLRKCFPLIYSQHSHSIVSVTAGSCFQRGSCERQLYTTCWAVKSRQTQLKRTYYALLSLSTYKYCHKVGLSF